MCRFDNMETKLQLPVCCLLSYKLSRGDTKYLNILNTNEYTHTKYVSVPTLSGEIMSQQTIVGWFNGRGFTPVLRLKMIYEPTRFITIIFFPSTSKNHPPRSAVRPATNYVIKLAFNWPHNLP